MISSVVIPLATRFNNERDSRYLPSAIRYLPFYHSPPSTSSYWPSFSAASRTFLPTGAASSEP